MIIVEGPDNSGKSTLIKQLLELDPGLRVLSRKKFDRHKDETIGTSYLEELIPEDGDRFQHGYAIADRFFASECIYGKMFRRGCRMTPSEHRSIRNLLTSYGTVVVYCRPSDNNIRKTWKERKQLFAERDPIAIANRYDQTIDDIFKGAYDTFYRYNWGRRDAPILRERIIQIHKKVVEEQRKALVWWSANPHGIGCLRDPKVVLIGEELSPRAVVPIPFVSGPAADFLTEFWNRVCRETNIWHDETYLTNALKGPKGNEAALRHELESLGSLTIVITLGRIAEKMYGYVGPSLKSQPHWIRMPHPQYIRRFHWENRHQYVADLIKQLRPITG